MATGVAEGLALGEHRVDGGVCALAVTLDDDHLARHCAVVLVGCLVEGDLAAVDPVAERRVVVVGALAGPAGGADGAVGRKLAGHDRLPHTRVGVRCPVAELLGRVDDREVARVV